MKKFLFFLMVIVASVTASAQDVIVKNDNSTILCRIIEVNNNEVIYLKWSDLNGPRYVMDSSLISNINYQDGRQDKLNQQTSNAYAPGNQQTGAAQFNDNILLTMDMNRSVYEHKAKKLRIIGWTVGSVLTIGGAILLLEGTGDFDIDSDQLLIVGGAVVMGAGVGTTIGCLIRANQIQKKAQVLSAAPVFQQEFKLGNGKSLCAGVDVIRDRQFNQATLGLGLHYNF